LIHVIDAADPEREAHMAVVSRLIEKLAKPGVPVICCYNKADLVQPEELPVGDGVVAISAKTGEGVDRLLDETERQLCRSLHRVTLLLPYTMAGQVQILHDQAQVLRCDYADRGIEIEAVCDDILYGRLKQYEI
ncbi:MAG: GTPase HflX, partial [Firmicutes bacterium]|nr:GTPase HflX [Bacillota bacterium]